MEPEDYIICTTDKDLNMIRGWHYNMRKNEKFWVDEDDTLYTFYTQVLTGDRVDNIPGLHGIGPKKAEKILKGCKTEDQLYEAVLKAYDNNEEYLCEQAQLLWIRRKPNQLWRKPR
jgi:5'-3' exonuclease